MNLTVDTKPPELSRMLVQRGEHDEGDSGPRLLYLQFDEAVDKVSFRPSALQLLVYLGPSTVRMRLSAAKQVGQPETTLSSKPVR